MAAVFLKHRSIENFCIFIACIVLFSILLRMPAGNGPIELVATTMKVLLSVFLVSMTVFTVFYLKKKHLFSSTSDEIGIRYGYGFFWHGPDMDEWPEWVVFAVRDNEKAWQQRISKDDLEYNDEIDYSNFSPLPFDGDEGYYVPPYGELEGDKPWDVGKDVEDIYGPNMVYD